MSRPSEWTPEIIFDKLKDRWPENFFDLYPGFSKSASPGAVCFFDSKRKAFAIANAIIEAFQSLPRAIPVYRTIAIKSLEELDEIKLGKCWSHSKESALRFAERELSPKNPILCLEGTVDHSDVDWDETLSRHLIFSMSPGGPQTVLSAEPENEIYVDVPHTVVIHGRTWVRKP
jgi:hypothetical protein